MQKIKEFKKIKETWNTTFIMVETISHSMREGKKTHKVNKTQLTYDSDYNSEELVTTARRDYPWDGS